MRAHLPPPFPHPPRVAPRAPQIPDAEAEKILSVEDAVNFISTHPQAK
jgi:hypothetical protein